ncbi:hypothetical protein [Deferrisoma sp.]
MRVLRLLTCVLLALAAPALAGESLGRLGPGDPAGPLAEVRAQARAAGLGDGEVKEAEDACREAGLTSAETARVLLLIARARVAGLPHEDLLSKLREGVAKGAPAEAILRVLERRTLTLRQASDLVERLTLEGHRPVDPKLAVCAVADALWAGASPSEVLRAVREDSALPDGLPDPRTAFAGP